MSKVGKMVLFQAHNEHPQFEGFSELAAVVGAVHPDGTLALAVFVPNKEIVWMDNVPAGEGHFSWRELSEVFTLTAAEQPAQPAPTTPAA